MANNVVIPGAEELMAIAEVKVAPERTRAESVAAELIAANPGVGANRLVSALGSYGIDIENARFAIRFLVESGGARVSANALYPN